MEEKMRRMRIASAGIALVAVMFMALLTGCPDGNNPSGTKSDKAELTGITVAGVTVATLPAAIPQADWEDLTQAYLAGETVVATAANLTDAAITATVSPKASVAFGIGYDHDRDTITFNVTSPHTFTANDFLYVKVTAEDGTTVNYYKFQITTATANANLSTLTVAGESASIGSPAATWDTITTPGNVSLTNAQKTDAKVVGIAAATTGTTIRYAKVANVPGAGAPTFAAADTFTFADGDFLYIEVTAADGVTKQIYKVEIEIGRNADLASITFGTRTANLGTGAATLAGVTAGYVVFTQEQPAAGFMVTITPEDSGATIAYAAGAANLTDAAITTAYTAAVAIPVNDTEFLFVKVTSAGGTVVKYYRIRVGHMQKAFIKAGSPEIRASSAKYIDPLWNDPDLEVYQINKIAPFNDTTNAYLTQAEQHPRYTYGTAKAMWDLDGMYLYVDVIDPEVTDTTLPAVTANTTSNAHERDSFELFINEKADSFTSTPGTQAEFVEFSGQYRVGADGFLSGHGPNALAAFTAFNKASAWKKDDGTGYIVIMQAPWLHASETGLEPVDGKEIGFELQINACTEEAARDGVMVWNNIAHSNYQTNTAYGVATLRGTPARNAARPVITAVTATPNFVETNQPATLSVTATVSDTGTMSYQWYSAATNGGAGTLITGATAATYAFTPTVDGTTWFYVVVTNTNNDVDGFKIVSNTSSYVSVIAGTYEAPTDWEERITSGQNALPVYGFSLPDGKTFGDYDRIVYELLVDPNSTPKSGRARVFGNFDLTTWGSNVNNRPNMGNDATNGKLINLNGNATYSDTTWTTVTAEFGNRDNQASAAEIKAASGIVALALGLFPNNDGGTTRIYYVRKIELWSDASGTEKISALYPEHPRLWGGSGSSAYVTDGNSSAFVTRELGWMDHVTNTGNTAPVYGFQLPAGKTIADYSRLNVELSTGNEAASGRLRAWGPFDYTVWPAANISTDIFNAAPAATPTTSQRLISNNSTNDGFSMAANTTWTPTLLTFNAVAALHEDVKALPGANGGIILIAFAPFPAAGSSEGTRNWYVRNIVLEETTTTQVDSGEVDPETSEPIMVDQITVVSSVRAIRPNSTVLWEGAGADKFAVAAGSNTTATRELLSASFFD
jgi:hypothetical protein